MATSDGSAALRAALRDLAADDARVVLEQARAAARERVRELLTEALSEAMLESLQAPAVPPVKSGAPADPAGEDGEDAAFYLYGVVGAGETAKLGSELVAVSEGPVAAIGARVRASEFGETELRAHLADMEWVERVAREHQATLDAVARCTTVVPMRMCTVYRSEEGVREMLRREAQALAEALHELEGRAEWGVKVYASRAGGGQSSRLAASSSAGELTGAGYLERRREERDAAELAAQRLEQQVARVHESLCEIAVEGLRSPLQRPAGGRQDRDMVLNGVYLLDDRDRPEFDQRLALLSDDLAADGLELEPTGPWPPYNFVRGTLGAAW